MTRPAPRAIAMLIRDVLAQDRARLAGMIALALAAALLEGFGILSLVPVAALAVSPDAMRDVPLVGAALAALAPPERLPAALAAFVALMAARALVIRARSIAQSALLAHYDAALRLRAVASLAERPWAGAALIGRDGMQALLHNDVPRAATALQYALLLLVTAILLAVQLVLAALLSVPMTLGVVALILLGAPAARIFFRRAQRSGETISERLALATEASSRLHDELKSAKAQGSTALFLDRYRASLDRLRRSHVGFGRDHATVVSLSGLSAALAAAMLVWAGVTLLRLDLPAVLGLLLLFSRMSGPAQLLVSGSNALAVNAPSFAAIVDRLGTLPAVVSIALPCPAAAPLAWSRLELSGATLELNGRRLLHAIDLSLDAGEWVAVEGPSGAGKTSLLDLVAGLHPPGGGRLLVDGVTLGPDRLPGWQRGLAYVGQDEMIYAASLRDNLTAGVDTVDPLLLARALDVSGLDALVAGWPEGLDLPLADRGRRLSGGERQRVGIARALLRDPRLLILDEATAALDLAAEAALFERLRALPHPPALLLVSHRPQTLARCDRRLHLAEGRLAR